MYKSNATGGSTVPKSAAKLSFSKWGKFTKDSQRIHIQFYEPEKNPNRVIFYNETIAGYDANAIDQWMDSEMFSGSTADTLDQVMSLPVDSEVHIQFKTVTTQEIDPTSLWNYLGIFPKYNIKSHLKITHTESTPTRTESLMSENDSAVRLQGEINVSPTDFFDTIITEKRDTTIVSALGVLGGVIGILIFIEVVLFGTKPNSPWGLVQSAKFLSVNRKGSKKNLSKYFLLPRHTDLPLQTPVHPRFSDIFDKHNQLNRRSKKEDLSSSSTCEAIPLELNYGLEQGEKVKEFQDTLPNVDMRALLERVNKIEARNQILELVLKTYYIDNSVFSELQNIVNERELAVEEEQDDSISQATAVRKDNS